MLYLTKHFFFYSLCGVLSIIFAILLTSVFNSTLVIECDGNEMSWRVSPCSIFAWDCKHMN